MTTPKNVALSILLAIAATAVSLASAELAWRWLKGVPPLSRDNLVQQALDLVRANTGLVVHDPLVGWRLKDEVHLGQAGFTTGRWGVRMNQTEIRPLRRGGILAVGDSFTAGSGVRDEEAWPARLEQLVGEPVTNGAAGGYGVDRAGFPSRACRCPGSTRRRWPSGGFAACWATPTWPMPRCGRSACGNGGSTTACATKRSIPTRPVSPSRAC
jgi:hypothetical protein